MTKPVRRKNPGEGILPHMDPSYPIRPLIDAETNIAGTVIVLPVPGTRQFVASTLEDPKVSVTASTRKSAERAAMRAYVEKRSSKRENPEPITSEDRADLRIAKRRMKERGGKSIEAIAEKYGYRL